MSDAPTPGSKEQPLPGAGASSAPAPAPQADRSGEQGAAQPVDQSAQEDIAQEREDAGGYG